MPDFNRIKYHKDGRVTVSGFPDITVATWKKSDKGGWDVVPARQPKSDGLNVSPRSLADDRIVEWAKRLGAWKILDPIGVRP